MFSDVHCPLWANQRSQWWDRPSTQFYLIKLAAKQDYSKQDAVPRQCDYTAWRQHSCRSSSVSVYKRSWKYSSKGSQLGKIPFSPVISGFCCNGRGCSGDFYFCLRFGFFNISASRANKPCCIPPGVSPRMCSWFKTSQCRGYLAQLAVASSVASAELYCILSVLVQSAEKNQQHSQWLKIRQVRANL